jgi:hypothetical protein
MSIAKLAGVLILSIVALASGCERWSSGAEAKIPLTTAPGLAVPDVDQLARKLESSLRYPQQGAKVYTREDGKWVEVKPVPVGKHFSAVVRSFDAKQGMAYVELTYREYNMPVVQIWRFDGKVWSDSVDPGIFVR